MTNTGFVYEKSIILTAITAALSDVLHHDAPLLDFEAHELALVHRFGTYIEQHLQPILCDYGLSIDLDYDRHGRAAKYLSCSSVSDDERRIRPDLILHRRGDDDANLLVLEWKKDAGPAVLARLEYRIASLLREPYSYRLGAIINSSKEHLSWRTYESGQKSTWQRLPSAEVGTA